MYVSGIVGPNSRGRSLGRWKDRVKKYMCERGGGVCSEMFNPLGDIPRGSLASKL